MAGVRYQLFFYDDTAARRLYRTTLIDRESSGEQVVELNHDGDPVHIDMESSDSLFEPIRGIKASIGLSTQYATASQGAFELRDLYTEDDRRWMVEVDLMRSEVAVAQNVFRGWLTTYGAKESYAQRPYPAKFTASCGLGTLKDYPFLDVTTLRPKVGIFTAFEIIRTCLFWVGYSMPLWVSVNTFEVSMISSGFSGAEVYSNRPAFPYAVLENFKIDTRRFLTDTGIGSCYEVLTQILKLFNAALVQDGGVWKLIRIDEYKQYILGQNGRINFVVYPDPVNSNAMSGVPYDAFRVVDAAAAMGIPIQESETSFQPSEKKLTVTFEYGDLKNQLVNGDFSQGLAGWVVPNVANGNLSGPAGQAVGDGSDGDPYGLQLLNTTYDNAKKEDPVFVRQTLSMPARGTNADVYTLSGIYKNFNCRGAKISVSVVVEGKGPYVLQGDGSWQPLIKGDIFQFFNNFYQESEGVERAKTTDGEKFSIETQPVPGKGPYDLIVLLYRGTTLAGQQANPRPSIRYQNLVLTKRDASRQNLTSDVVKGLAPGADRKRKADDLSLMLGDQLSVKQLQKVPKYSKVNGLPVFSGFEDKVVFFPRYGALMRWNGTPTEKWLPLGADPANTGAYKSTQHLCCTGRLSMTGQPATVFDGTLLMRHPDGWTIGPLDILQFNELVDAQGRVIYGLCTSHGWDLKRGTIEVRAVEILSVPGATVKRYWGTPDGLEPMNDDASQPASRGGPLEMLGKVVEGLKRAQAGPVVAIPWDPRESLRPNLGKAIVVTQDGRTAMVQAIIKTLRGF